MIVATTTKLNSTPYVLNVRKMDPNIQFFVSSTVLAIGSQHGSINSIWRIRTLGQGIQAAPSLAAGEHRQTKLI